MDRIEDLTRMFEHFPGIGPRQAKRFVYHLLGVPQGERSRMAELLVSLSANVKQCSECMRYYSNSMNSLCTYCVDISRDDALLMVLEKDQDLAAVERTGAYRGRYFVLGGVLTLSGKGRIREQELIRKIERQSAKGLREIVLALSATTEGEHTTDHLREALHPLAGDVKLTLLGRGLSTGSELEYADTPTLTGAFLNRKET